MLRGEEMICASPPLRALTRPTPPLARLIGRAAHAAARLNVCEVAFGDRLCEEGRSEAGRTVLQCLVGSCFPRSGYPSHKEGSGSDRVKSGQPVMFCQTATRPEQNNW